MARMVPRALRPGQSANVQARVNSMRRGSPSAGPNRYPSRPRARHAGPEGRARAPDTITEEDRMRLPLAFAAFLIAAAPLMADTPTVKSICEEAPSLDVQRERLQTLARATDATAPADAAEAWLALARNYEYAGAGDSAIACYRRAIERRGGANELLGAADALFRRLGSGDAEEALGYSQRAASQPVEGLSPQTVRARIAWAQFLTGHTEQAHTLFTRMERS